MSHPKKKVYVHQNNNNHLSIIFKNYTKKPIPGLLPFRVLIQASRQSFCFAGYIDGLFRQRKTAAKHHEISGLRSATMDGKNPISKRSTMIKEISTTGRDDSTTEKKSVAVSIFINFVVRFKLAIIMCHFFVIFL